MVNALNLPIYVIGGGVSSAWDAFAPAMFEEMKFRSSIYQLTSPDRIGHDKGTIVTRALLGSDAGLYGAARLPMLENFSQTEEGRTTINVHSARDRLRSLARGLAAERPGSRAELLTSGVTSSEVSAGTCPVRRRVPAGRSERA